MALTQLSRALLSTSLFALLPVAAAADDMTVSEKFEALKAKGIFVDIRDGEGLDQYMNWAQLARVQSLILGRVDVSSDTMLVSVMPYSDIVLSYWYAEEIAAAKVGAILLGKSDGTFDAHGNISIQEIPKVAAGLLGLTPIEDADVGGTSSWAMGYVQSVVDAGFPFLTEYTKPATRSMLTDLAYTADWALVATPRFDETLLQRGYIAKASAAGGTLGEIGFYRKPEAGSASMFKSTSVIDTGLLTLTPQASAPYATSGYELTVLEDCDDCFGLPMGKGLTYSTLTKNPGSGSAESFFWISTDDTDRTEFGSLGADAYYSGAALGYRIEDGSATSQVSGSFTANYQFTERTGTYEIALTSAPKFSGSFTADASGVVGSGSTGMASGIKGDFGKDQVFGDLLYGAFWAGTSTDGYQGIFASSKTTPPPEDDLDPPDPAYSGKIAWSIPDPRDGSEDDILADGFMSSKRGSSEVRIQAHVSTAEIYAAINTVTPDSYSGIWNDGTAVSDGAGFNFDGGSFTASTSAICGTGCAVMSWGRWSTEDELDGGFWITGPAGDASSVAEGARYLGTAHAVHSGIESSGAFSAEVTAALEVDYEITGVWDTDLTGTFDLGANFHATGGGQYIKGQFTGNGDGMFGTFGFDQDGSTFNGSGIFGARRRD